MGQQNRKHCHFVANKYRSSQDEDVKTRDITLLLPPPSPFLPWLVRVLTYRNLLIIPLLVENCSRPVNYSGAGRIRISEGEPG